MREIKFRIWDKEKLCFIVDMNNYMISPIDGHVLYVDGHDCVDRLIPLQHTGLKDKNGVEIYEGDIIKSQNAGPYLVKWFDCLYWDGGGSCAVGFYLENTDIRDGELDYHTRLSIDSKLLKVIGNIYENTELLK